MDVIIKTHIELQIKTSVFCIVKFWRPTTELDSRKIIIRSMNPVLKTPTSLKTKKKPTSYHISSTRKKKTTSIKMPPKKETTSREN